MTATLLLVFITMSIYLTVRLIRSPAKRSSAAYLAGFLILSYAFGPYLSNQGSLITNEYYLVPRQTSLFTFQPIIYDQEGSGDNWIYARDCTYYYYSGPDIVHTGSLYVYISRKESANCKAFRPTHFDSWCAYYTHEGVKKDRS
jgi:hypothetical protein